MKPENVNPNNFKVESIIYNDGDFSIAYGQWYESDNTTLAARWNGDDDNNGYPNDRNGRPIWFIIPENLRDIFLTTLLSSPHSDKKNIISIFNSN